MEVDATQIRSYEGKNLLDASGSKIGRVDDIYMDEDTGKPEWLAVTSGMFGTRTSFVPITGVTAAGGDLQVPYEKQQVLDAPNAEADGQLSQEEEARLYSHYGIAYSDDRSDSGLPAGGNGTTTSDTTRGTTSDTATGTTGTDDAMTRSEEELDVETRNREAGRVRLRKWVETEHVEQTVPVRREEVRVEREPITDANRDRALQGAEITEGEHEVVLHEEEAVASTHVEPKERIRLDTEVVTENETVDAELRKERIEVDGDVMSDAERH
jgi:uncharacterized protein (TIGR02271 family)